MLDTREPFQHPVTESAFYESALPAHERALYLQAFLQQGLSGEIAMLRFCLHRLFHARALSNAPEESSILANVLRIVNLLVKAQHTHQRNTSHQHGEADRALDEAALCLLAQKQ